MNTPIRFAHELRPGEEYEPLHFSISADVNQQFLYAIEDYSSIYVRGPGGTPGLVHPVLLLHMSARTRSPSFKLAPNTGSIFARDKVIFHRPARVGEPLISNWIIKDVYERKGRLYQCLSIQVRGSDDVVVDREMHSVFFTRDGSRLQVPEIRS